MKTVHNHGLKCKYCKNRDLRLEKRAENLYMGKCTNPEHVYSVYLKVEWIPKWTTV